MKTLVKEDNNAAIIEANIMPLSPVGNNRTIRNAYEIFEQPDLLSQIDWHSSGLEHPISSKNVLNLIFRRYYQIRKETNSCKEFLKSFPE